MATFSWTRKLITAQQWTNVQQKTLLAQLNSGQSIVQTFVQWGFGGTTNGTVIPTAVMGNVAALGMVTKIGNGSESPPDPLAAPGNANPPAERWLYWSARAPVVANWDATASVVAWRSSEPDVQGQTEAQVLAPSGMGVGNFLDYWMTWNTEAPWDSSGQAVLWCAVQALVRTPL